ncbi:MULTISPECIES: D-alanine--D-alanine ligase [unclassified Campylobacter]|uniref:D-alanine--D-alanine ligase n=1 Tax=unclassified Campylobacter TaxID=2593542 RepID=UPI001237E44B|nr:MULTISPECIES: D-alanine--D-alanine ligase [unclassified Campylobacter]KAA6225352.1 D-alanine--D-alanine ligase [Campylobacter sp. LR185c]KAA6227048.1 D-alanine--D-alanine ligase [Campylobacter sp. LR196d]KAA6227619.1 D-alanine--D-alanine ligase [Campylobacter sp. LR286c]KAA6229484.1 D-alanine--D-alanine ligase [Campylobacter sp. LR264d]KAA8604956.1 D-alanine--D-alanine ligase A [Campylobacter sp. LR185c]
MKYLILFGGNSYEHEISIVSAVVLKKILNNELCFVFCDKDRKFYEIPKEKLNAKIFSSNAYKKEKELFLKQGGFFSKSLFGTNDLSFDCIINLIHGKDGEDGKIAALCEFYSLKYIGPRMEASVLSFNKELTKLYAKNVGVKTLPYVMLRKNQALPKINYPCILKPARLGSSIGISVLKDDIEFNYAQDVGFEFDTDIIVEEFKSNIKEYNLAGCMVDDEFIFSIIEEPHKKELLDFEQKYYSFSNSSEVVEADISESLKEKLRQSFKKIYNPLFKGALIRCDFFVLDNEVYLNEINPNPGSLANYLFKDFNQILERLAKSVKNEEKIEISYSFLHSINGQKGKL